MGILNDAMDNHLRNADAASRESIIANTVERMKRGEFAGKGDALKARRYFTKVILHRMVATGRPGELDRLKPLIAGLEALDRKRSGAKKS
jgi:hypothetical protein